MAFLIKRLNKPSVSDYYLVEWHLASEPGIHNYSRWHYSAEFDVWNSWAATQAEAKRDTKPGTIGGSDEIVISGWTQLGDKGLHNLFKELIYAGPNHV